MGPEALQEPVEKTAHGLHIPVGEEGGDEGHGLAIRGAIIAPGESYGIAGEAVLAETPGQFVQRDLEIFLTLALVDDRSDSSLPGLTATN
jgi:hypothetical protein